MVDTKKMNENLFGEFAFVHDVKARDMNNTQLDQAKSVNKKGELFNNYKMENEQLSNVVKPDTFTTETELPNLGGIEYDRKKRRTKDPRPPIFRFTLPSNHKGNIIKELSFVPPSNNSK